MGDAAWVAALYAEDGVLLGPGEDPVIGRDAIRAREHGFLTAYKIEMALDSAECEPLGEKGWGYGSFRATLTPHGGGEAIRITGKYLNIVRLREDGTLEICRHCWNADQPIPAPQAAGG
jgi:ketosteroid isomerase-like protein